MKKSVKIVSGITAFLLIAIILYFANGYLGNPVSKMIANKNGKEYISKEYKDMNLQTKEASYSFKDGRYHIQVKSLTSKDTYFEVVMSPFGKVVYDDYEINVTNKWNTYERINEAYESKVDEVFENKDFPYKIDICYGEIKEKDIEQNSEYYKEYNLPVYGIDRKNLILDKDYDINELGKTAGHIVFYAQNEEITLEKASEILLNIKNILSEKNIYFYAIDFTLEKPRDKDGTANPDDTSINIKEFLYKDIYKEGLEKRLEKSQENTEKYYEKLDEEKLKQEELYDN